MKRPEHDRQKKKICVVVAAHKPYWMPQDPMYVPVQVGAEGKPDLGMTPDNTGEHISARNANYCELTGLYWAWKNLDADYLGLVHYRRYFVNPSKLSGERSDEQSFQHAISGKNRQHASVTVAPSEKKVARLLTREHALQMLREVDILLPEKRHYWIETNYSQYVHAHHAVDLETTRVILLERHPEALEAYDRVMRRRSGHRFNMFLMKRDLADAWCEWLFGILFELEQRLDIRDYSDNDKRVFGFVAERLLDVWLESNRLPYREIPYVFLEQENWLKKGWAFVQRKIKGSRRWQSGS